MTQKRTLLTFELLTELTSVHQPPCLSLYQPDGDQGRRDHQALDQFSRVTVSIPYVQDKEEHHGTIGNTRRARPSYRYRWPIRAAER
jgi:hypothetical protein